MMAATSDAHAHHAHKPGHKPADNNRGLGATTLERPATSSPAFHTYLEMPRVS
jgi:hypothetical protein